MKRVRELGLVVVLACAGWWSVLEVASWLLEEPTRVDLMDTRSVTWDRPGTIDKAVSTKPAIAGDVVLVELQRQALSVIGEKKPTDR
jgi:hypothetical protein